MNSKFSQTAVTPKTTRATPKKAAKVVKVISFNINTDRRWAKDNTIGLATPYYNLEENRGPEIVLKVVESGAELVILFEVDPDAVEFIEAQFSSHGYKCSHFTYNKSRLAFSFMVLSKNEKLLKHIEAIPLTKSGSYIEDSARPCAPKAGEAATPEYLAYKEEILLDPFERTVIKVSIGNVDYYCTHLGLQNNARMLQTQMLREIVETQSISKARSFIIFGDFNSFDATKSTPTLLAEQIEILSSMYGVTWDSKHILATFRAFIFDIVFKMIVEEKDEYFRLLKAGLVAEFRAFCELMADKYGLGGCALDHVFSSEELQVHVDAVDMGSLSDHFMMVMTIE